MITQYSHQQITLSDREKEYAWFHYAAQIINAGCMDQSLSGYSITGTGSDGKTVSAELTNEELFQIFSEVKRTYKSTNAGRKSDGTIHVAGRCAARSTRTKRLSDPDRATRVKNEKSRCQYRMG